MPPRDRAPLPSVSETYYRLTGMRVENGMKVATDTLAVPCVNPNSHRSGDSKPSLHIQTTKDAWICRVCIADGTAAAQGRSLALVQFAGIAKTEADAMEWLLPKGRSDDIRGGQGDPNDTARIVAQYDYVDPAGTLLYRVERYEYERSGKKTFRQKRPDGMSGWIHNLDGVARVPYDLPGLLAAIEAGETIYVVEGEKTVKAIRDRGLYATTNAGGAGGVFDAAFAKWFQGAVLVYVIGDNDEPGRKAARLHADLLAEYAMDVRRVDNLPDVPEKGDAFDFFASGKTAEDFVRVVALAGRKVGPSLDDGSLHLWTLSAIGAIIRSEPPARPGVPFGIRKLDEALDGMQSGKMTTLGARVNVGKTAAQERISLNAALNGFTVSVGSMEMGGRGFWMRCMARAFDLSVHEFRKARSDPQRINPERMAAYERQFEENLRIIGATRSLNVQAIEEHLEKRRPDLLVLDHARHIEGWMTGAAAGKGRSDLAPADILYALTEMLPKYGTHLLLLSQCTRDAHASRPQLNELRDSGALEEVSENVIFLHRPFMYDEAKGGEVDDVMEWMLSKSREAPRFISHTEWVGETMDIVEHDELHHILRISRCCTKNADDDKKKRSRDDYG